MLLINSLFIITIIASSINLNPEFNNWYKKHQDFLDYISSRFNITREEHFKQWFNNYIYVKEFNKLNKSYKLSINSKFSSLNNTIINKLLLNNRKSLNKNYIKKNININPVNYNNHQQDYIAIDYRKQCSDIRDQGNCGSCYSFGSVGAIEARLNIKYNKKFDLSEQQVVSCSQSYGNNGCSGGISYSVYDYILNNNLGYEEDFNYCACNKQCKEIPKHVKISNYSSVYLNIKSSFINGPIDIAMHVVNSFVLYSDGYYYETECESDPNLLNHEMVAVGYGYDKFNQLYYIIRNSWGSDWGMNGYAYVYEGVCGVDSDPVEPIGCSLI